MVAVVIVAMLASLIVVGSASAQSSALAEARNACEALKGNWSERTLDDGSRVGRCTYKTCSLGIGQNGPGIGLVINCAGHNFSVIRWRLL